MVGKAHMAIGAGVGLLASRLLVGSQDVVFLSALLAGVAAGLPDVLDAENAAGREPLGLSWAAIKREARHKRRSPVTTLFLALRAIVALLVDGIAAVLPHRGPTHWLSVWLVLSVAALAVSRLAGGGLALPVAFSVGYLSHLLADAPTLSGVALFAPFWPKPVHVLPRRLRFRYDSPVQWLVVLAVWGLAALAWRPELSSLLAEGGR